LKTTLFLSIGVSLIIGLPCSLGSSRAKGEDFVPAPDTQNPADHPPSPREAVEKITVPDGFHVDLFAAEPDVRQPLDMKFDSRGRLWVVESYSYDGYKFAEGIDDRILIFEDTDRDGTFDKRTVFWDKANRLTSLEFAPGGIYILNAAELQFLPDADGDDIPDGAPVTLLDGFDTENIGHNIVSGLIWGPDGWIYARHGIKATSRPGPPHVPPSQREPINCGIWRYHPATQRVEVVVHGTTNPWGLDYNEDGEFFFTNNVIGHLWHVIPGAHYKRMYGDDFNPHLYELIDQHADHYHWDHSQNWTDSREAVGVHNELGGGHSHCGGMIYLGDNWPAEYRGSMFMCNVHGRRLNQDRLKRHGSGYVGTHAPDFLFANQPWFRGVCLAYGPDGSVYVSDWCDFGECHDHDGVHRSSGRIYRIRYGEPVPIPTDYDLEKVPTTQLVNLHTHPNEWVVRTARRILFERQQAGEDLYAAEQALLRYVIAANDSKLSLKAAHTLATLQRVNPNTIAFLLGNESEHHRVWGLRLLAEFSDHPDDWFQQLIEMSIGDDSGLVRLHLASISQKLPADLRWSVLESLAMNTQDIDDHNLPLMIWYGLEPLVPSRPKAAISLAKRTPFPDLQNYLARRVTSEIQDGPEGVNELVAILDEIDSVERQTQLLRGMSDALKGWRKAPAPEAWGAVSAKLAESSDETIRTLAQELSLVFGDGRAMEALRKVATDTSADPATRCRALDLLVQADAENLKPLLLSLMNDRATTPSALAGLASIDDPDVAARIIARYPSFRADWGDVAIQTLSSRVSFAEQLLDAIAKGKIPREDVSAAQARQIEHLGSEKLTKKLVEVWGTLRQTPAEKLERIADYKRKLTPETLAQADLVAGRELFKKNCANCHRLFGEGEKIAPDLTGSNRDNLDYLLINMIDPSAEVPQTFKVSVVVMQDGRVLTGVLGRDDGETVDLQTAQEKLTLRKADIEETKSSPLSLMPDGLIEKLSDAQVRDLIGYLQAARPPRLSTHQKR
jgi:putative membrane-bound dehydrogenase-like protein